MRQPPTRVFWRTLAAILLLGLILFSASCAAISEFLQRDPMISDFGSPLPDGRRVPIPPTVDDLGVNN